MSKDIKKPMSYAVSRKYQSLISNELQTVNRTFTTLDQRMQTPVVTCSRTEPNLTAYHIIVFTPTIPFQKPHIAKCQVI